jgi:hypothetical protein
MFLVKIIENRGRSSTWVCLLGAVRVVFICFDVEAYVLTAVGNIFHWHLGEGDGLLP